MDPEGNFLWAKAICTPGATGAANDDVTSIKVDSLGNIILAGTYVQLDFDPGVGDQTMTATGNSDGFILKLDANGDFVWVKTLQGTSNKRIGDIVLDENNNIYTTGRYQGSIDLDPSSSTTDIRTTMGNFDSFVAKYDSSGNYVWGQSWGGTASDLTEKVIVNGNNVYVAGAFTGSVNLNPTGAGSPSVTSPLTSSDGYISSFTKDGVYNSSFVVVGNSSNLDTIQDVYFDESGNIYASGNFQSMTLGGNTYTSNGANADSYFLKLTNNLEFSNIYIVSGSNI